MESQDCPLQNLFEEHSVAENIKQEHSADENMLEKHLVAETPTEDDGVPETEEEKDMILEDPLAPTLRNQALDSQAKLMVLNVIKYFQKFRIARALATGEDMNVNLAVSEATGVSQNKVKHIYSEYKNKGIEMAIRPPSTSRCRKRKTDIIVEVNDDCEEPPKMIKKRQRKQL